MNAGVTKYGKESPWLQSLEYVNLPSVTACCFHPRYINILAEKLTKITYHGRDKKHTDI